MTKTDSTTTELSAKDQKIASYRALLDFIEAHPELDIPYSMNRASFICSDLEEAARVVKTIPGVWSKNDPNESDYDAAYLVMKNTFEGLRLEMIVGRGTTCEKKVVGTEKRTVAKLVTEAVYEEVEEDVDVVEFECGSLLSVLDEDALANLEAVAS